MSWDIYHLHATSARGIWWQLPPVAVVLAHTICIRRGTIDLGVYPGAYLASVDRKPESEGYQGVDDV